MIRIKSSDIAAQAGGQAFGRTDICADGVVIDSRQGRPGAMFVAYIGPNNDGHDYIEDAYSWGCRVFFVSNEAVARALSSRLQDAAFVLVDHTERALVRFAESYLNRLDVVRVAVTGSVGKTTTKDMTAAVLARAYATVSTEGNLNTTLGQCLTALRADERTQVIVFEMGMDRPGEIESYCRWVRPHVALLTNVGTAHMEYLGSREGIAREKLQIASYLREKDVLIYNGDCELLSDEFLNTHVASPCDRWKVGLESDASFRIRNVEADGLGVSFELLERNGEAPGAFRLQMLGRHNAWNAALAAACGRRLGLPFREIAEALASVEPAERRLRVETLGDVLLLDDTYNAGPDSMRAALHVLAGVEGRRRIAVLADILELGDVCEQEHRSVGREVAATQPDVLLAVGPRAKNYVSGAEEAGYRGLVRHVHTSEEAAAWLVERLSAGDVVLVKGSNSTGVVEVARAVRDIYRREEGDGHGDSDA